MSKIFRESSWIPIMMCVMAVERWALTRGKKGLIFSWETMGAKCCNTEIAADLTIRSLSVNTAATSLMITEMCVSIIEGWLERISRRPTRASCLTPAL
ncbi:hypothetical protein GDO78_002892 [Eleutherodactylus coqui]|uniref:Uncharacterized protein n=1 Tax=Eleutherodactylus coqui TaxID=57060 RepID=A0A8J6K1N8_ELECQ|nr:hypothetical protein GDO78_002892 [Eleutherodactylus coqui]